MIRYALTCAARHEFESWFQSSAAYDRLAEAGRVTCPACGSSEVHKALMAPAVMGADKAPEPAENEAQGTPPSPAEIERALAALRKQVEENSDYVGMNFATEARRIHAGEAPERSIYGETRPDEARKLIEDGVPVAPLPFVPRRKTN
jgi:hypothetical protein